MDTLVFVLLLSAGFLYALYKAIYNRGQEAGRRAGHDRRQIWTGQEDPPPDWRR